MLLSRAHRILLRLRCLLRIIIRSSSNPCSVVPVIMHGNEVDLHLVLRYSVHNKLVALMLVPARQAPRLEPRRKRHATENFPPFGHPSRSPSPVLDVSPWNLLTHHHLSPLSGHPEELLVSHKFIQAGFIDSSNLEKMATRMVHIGSQGSPA